MIKEKIWTEYYRPSNLDDLILLPRIKEQFKDGLNGNYILYGSPGIGKTSLSKILIKDSGNYKYFKSSQRIGINDIEKSLEEFCNSWNPINEGQKIVFFDEFMVTKDFQEAIRGFVEEASAKGIRWLITTNYPSEITTALKSRFKLLDFNFQNKEEKEFLYNEYLKRLKNISIEKKINIDDDTLKSIIETKFPDLRSMVEHLHTIYLGVSNIKTIEKNKKFDMKLFFSSKIENDKIWEIVNLDYKGIEKGVFSTLGRSLIELIINKLPQFNPKIPVLALKWKENESLIEKSTDPSIILFSYIMECRKELIE